MKADFTKAAETLRRALNAVEEGTAKHGDTAKSFEMIAQLWTTHIAHSMAIRKQVMLTAADVATMMMMVKQARSVYGHSADNYIDAAGYASLAAMLDPLNTMDKELDNALNDTKPIGSGDSFVHDDGDPRSS